MSRVMAGREAGGPGARDSEMTLPERRREQEKGKDKGKEGEYI